MDHKDTSPERKLWIAIILALVANLFLSCSVRLLERDVAELQRSAIECTSDHLTKGE